MPETSQASTGQAWMLNWECTWNSERCAKTIVIENKRLNKLMKSQPDPLNRPGRNYIITWNYYSNFWEVDYLVDTQARTVIWKLKAHFSRYGIPNALQSDNGSPYSAVEFKWFSTKCKSEPKTSDLATQKAKGRLSYQERKPQHWWQRQNWQEGYPNWNVGQSQYTLPRTRQ